MTDLPQQDQPLHGPNNDAGDGQVVAETMAKQGLRGRHMMVVLSVSIVLAAVLLMVIWAFNAGPLRSASRANRPAPAAGSHIPDGSARGADAVVHPTS